MNTSRMGIRSRVWLAAALPALLALVALASLMVDHHREDLTDAMGRRTLAMAQQLAGAAEFAVFAYDTEALDRLAAATRTGDQEVLGVAVLGPAGQTLASSGQVPPAPWGSPEPALIATPASMMAVTPIRGTTLGSDDLFSLGAAAGSAAPAAGLAPVLGYAVVHTTLQGVQQRSRQLVIWAVEVALGTLLIAAAVAVVLASSVTRPIRDIAGVVDRLRDGDLKARTQVERSGPLARLADGINRMAERLSLTQDDLRQQVAQATDELRRQRDAAEAVARIDPLTGVATRRAFTESAQNEVQRALRYGSTLSVVMVDIDHFKRINDAHGHAAGDAVLTAFAQTLRRELRDVDVVGRLGGEEFALMLPSVGLREAQRVAERARTAVAACSLQVLGETLRFTASFGVAEHHPAELDFAGVLGRADQALYAAKRNGRNRVEPPALP